MGLGWDGLGWDWDLCAGLFYEHRFAMLKIKAGAKDYQSNTCSVIMLVNVCIKYFNAQQRTGSNGLGLLTSGRVRNGY